MALINPPLYMQLGKYAAEKDRLLIGALLFPSGGTSQLPRPGIRPSGLNNGIETSFRVSGKGVTGRVAVAAGAAFVPTSDAVGKLSGMYLVVNDAEVEVNCEVSGVSSGQSVKVYLQARDAEFGLGAPTYTAEAGFLVLPATTAKPSGTLLLATVVWNGATAAVGTVTDEREYTSGFGGTVRVQNVSQLTGNGSLADAPHGSSAYVHADGLVYTRSVRGWEAAGAVMSGTTNRPLPAAAYEGMQYYDTGRGLLQVFAGGTWVTVGSRPAVVGRTVSDLGSKPDLRVVRKEFKPGPHCWLKIPTGGFKTFAETSVTTTPPSGAKPSDESLQVRVRVFSNNTVVRAVLSASGWVPAGNSLSGPVTYLDGNANLAVEVKQYVSSSPVGAVTDPDSGSAYVPDTYSSGLTFYNKMDVLKSRTIHYQLNPGDYLFSVKVGHSGDGSTPGFGYFQIHQIVLEVSA